MDNIDRQDLFPMILPIRMFVGLQFVFVMGTEYTTIATRRRAHIQVQLSVGTQLVTTAWYGF